MTKSWNKKSFFKSEFNLWFVNLNLFQILNLNVLLDAETSSAWQEFAISSCKQNAFGLSIWIYFRFFFLEFSKTRTTFYSLARIANPSHRNVNGKTWFFLFFVIPTKEESHKTIHKKIMWFLLRRNDKRFVYFLFILAYTIFNF